MIMLTVKVIVILSLKLQESKRKLHHLSSDSESGSAEKQDSDYESDFCSWEGTALWQEQYIILNLKKFRGKTNTYRLY
jgi:hypothetical protein